MGKAKGGGSSSSKKGSNAAKSVCQCVDPYQCTCGNRPERPSRGHKWDPITQTWGGKGHKQRGASGQAAVSANVLPLATTATPSLGRKGNYAGSGSNNSGGGGGSVGGAIVVGGSSSLVIGSGGGREGWKKQRGGGTPTSSSQQNMRILSSSSSSSLASATSSRQDDTSSTTTSKHQLFVDGIVGGTNGNGSNNADSNKCQATTTISNTTTAPPPPPLPPRWRPTSTNTTSSTNTSKEEERIRHNQEIATRRRKHQAILDANKPMEVFLSGHFRKRIERLLWMEMDSTEDDVDNGNNTNSISNESVNDDEEGDNISNEEEEMEEIDTHRRLVRDGFSSCDVLSALRIIRTKRRRRNTNERCISREKRGETRSNHYEEVLQYLCIRLNEDELPTGFDHRKGTLDVLRPKDAGGVGGARDVEEMTTSKSMQMRPNEGNVVDDDNITGGGDENEVLNDGVVLRFAKRFGLTRREALAIRSYSRSIMTSITSSTMPISCKRASDDEDDDTMKRAFWSVLVDAAPLDGAAGDGLPMSLSDEDRRRNLDASTDELEAIESIFVGDGEVTIERNEGMTCVSIALPPFGNDKLFLEVHYADGFYPDVPPMAFVVSIGGGLDSSCEKASSYHCGGKVHLDLVRHLSEMGHGREVIFELFGIACSLLQEEEAETLSTVPSSSALLSHLQSDEVKDDDNSAEVNEVNNAGNNLQGPVPSKDSTIDDGSLMEADESRHSRVGRDTSLGRERPMRPTKRRPRDRDTFWNVPPGDAPPAASLPIPTALARDRKSLPAAAVKDQFLSLLASAVDCGGRVLLVTGETGCGKTTQIPQFILESSPVKSKIIVAQPRRLAATGVASRVALERGESRPGMASVGYVVRGDSKTCNSTRLLFCTTGVLLRQLQSRSALENVSHIVIDEVHERHLDTDVLLAILKQTLPSLPNLSVVLMSATMDADRFANYWGEGTPRMHIPGRTFPVQDVTLEGVLEMTCYIPPKKKKKKQQLFRGDSGGSNRNHSYFDSELDADYPAERETGSTLEACVVPLEERLKRMNEDEIDYDLIAVLIKTLLQRKEDDGSILVFLPGAGEIERTERAIHQFVKGFNVTVLPLHGGLQTEKQQLVFVPAQKGCTKVILSTNVAETSITIPDCTIVVDTCKEKQSSYDPTNRMPLLLERFASRDSLKQRRGRAGRVRPGTCYKLISSSLHAKLPEHGEPEIKRCALDQTLLSLLYIGLENGSGEFIRTLLDPPSRQSIDSALYFLEKIGALKRDGDLALLTPLGMHLAGIPSPPVVGKLLVMGCLLGCRDISVAIAAGMSAGRSPFLRIDSFNNGHRRSEDEVEKELASTKVIEQRAALFKMVGNSDHAMVGKAFLLWRDSNGASERRRFCEKLGLAFNGMQDMLALTRQLDSSLSSLGFLPSLACNRNENSWRIVRSVVVASLSPTQVIRVQRPSTKYTETVEGAVEKEGEAKELKYFIRGGGEHTTANTDQESANRSNVHEERVFIHPSSLNFIVGTFSCPWLVYHRLIHTSKAFVSDATECNPYSLLLFGGPMEVQASKGLIVLDNWIQLSANARIGSLIGGLRKKVDDLLELKISHPSVDISDATDMKLITEYVYIFEPIIYCYKFRA